MTWALDGKPLRSVLVTRLRYLGDVVMSTVVVQALKLGDPHLRVGFLCEGRYAPVLDGHPDLDRLHVLGLRRRGADAAARVGGSAGDREGRSFPGTVAGLRSGRYDLAVDLFFNPRSCLLLRAAGIPARIGGTRSWRRRLYTHTVGPEDLAVSPSAWQAVAPGGLGDHLSRLAPLRHLESGLPFAQWMVGARFDRPLLPRLHRPEADRATGACLSAVGVGAQDPYLLLCPGATWQVKEWPPHSWCRLVARLVRERTEKIVVLVPPGRQDPWGAMAREIPPGRGGVLPPLALPSVLRILGRAAAVISVDGGVMHAAVGLGVPTVALFGATEPAIWFPYGCDRRFRVLSHRPPCHPCHLHRCGAFSCLPSILPSEVAAALAEVLSVAQPPEHVGRGGVEPETEVLVNHRRKESP